MIYDSCLCVLFSALTVMILGCWNPRHLQTKSADGTPSGHPNYLWLALISLLVGLVCCMLLQGADMAWKMPSGKSRRSPKRARTF